MRTRVGRAGRVVLGRPGGPTSRRAGNKPGGTCRGASLDPIGIGTALISGPARSAPRDVAPMGLFIDRGMPPDPRAVGPGLTRCRPSGPVTSLRTRRSSPAWHPPGSGGRSGPGGTVYRRPGWLLRLVPPVGNDHAGPITRGFGDFPVIAPAPVQRHSRGTSRPARLCPGVRRH